MHFTTLFPLILLGLASSSAFSMSLSRPVTEIAPSMGYNNNCEGKHTDQSHFCWTFNEGSMSNAWIQMSNNELASTDNFFVKFDNQYKDFSVADLHKPFTLVWRDGLIVMYYNGLKAQGCYTVTVEAGMGYDLRIHSDDGVEAGTASVGSQHSPGRRSKKSQPICSKWAQLYVSQ